MQVYTLLKAAPGASLSTSQRAYNFVQIQEAARLLGMGELVAFPTETVYGLGANAFSSEAVAKIFACKGRPSDNPLIVHIGTKAELGRVAIGWPNLAEGLMNRFWPGPLTLVLAKRPQISPLVTSGLETVAVRMPDHPVALQLLKAVGLPIAAPSANRSGRPSPTTAQHVLEDLQGHIAALIDAGSSREGVESTVLDLSGAKPAILRPGSITREMLLPYIPQLESSPPLDPEAAPSSPGTKYTHYAPRAALYLYRGDPVAVRRRMAQDAAIWRGSYRKIAVMLSEPFVDSGFPEDAADLFLDLSADSEHLVVDPNIAKDSAPADAELDQEERLRRIGSNLFAALRLCDSERISVILAQGVEAVGLGEAIMNRLSKAARDVIYLTGGH